MGVAIKTKLIPMQVWTNMTSGIALEWKWKRNAKLWSNKGSKLQQTSKIKSNNTRLLTWRGSQCAMNTLSALVDCACALPTQTAEAVVTWAIMTHFWCIWTSSTPSALKRTKLTGLCWSIMTLTSRRSAVCSYSEMLASLIS